MIIYMNIMVLCFRGVRLGTSPVALPTSATDHMLFIRILKIDLHKTLRQDQHRCTYAGESFSLMAFQRRLPCPALLRLAPRG